MNVIVLHSDHRHVSTIHAAIFRASVRIFIMCRNHSTPTTLKMATCVAETCRWSLCNKITFIKTKFICWSCKSILCT